MSNTEHKINLKYVLHLFKNKQTIECAYFCQYVFTAQFTKSTIKILRVNRDNLSIPINEKDITIQEFTLQWHDFYQI